MNSLIARARHRSFRSALLAGALLLSGCGGGSDDPLADARKAYAVGDLATARVHIENALQDKPQDGAARLLQGSIMLDMGDAESAEVSLRQAMNDAAIAGQVQEKLAEALIMRRKGKELLALLDGKNALTDDINAYLRVAALQTMDQWDEADAALASGLAAHPNGLKLLATAADRALSKGEFAQAEALGKRALAAAPEAYESQLLAGRLASLRGDLKTAQTHFERARAARPTSIVVLYALGSIAQDTGRPDDAEKLFSAAQAIRPKDPIANYFLAQMAFDKGDTEGASKILIEGDPTKAPIPQIAMLRGLIEAKRGKHWAAVPLLAPYVGNGGRDPRARFALAEAYVALKKPQEAWGILAPMADSPNAGPPVLALAAALANQLGKPPSNYQARYAQMQAADPIAARMTAAQAAMAAGKWQDADAIYTQLSEAGKDSLVPLLNNHALVKLALGDKDGATALARKAHKIAPNDPIVADTLGWVIFKSGGSTKEAEALIAQAATARPQDQEIAAHLRAVKSANSGN